MTGRPAALVTGATGFVASRLLKRLSELAIPTIAVTRDRTTVKARRLRDIPGVEVVEIEDYRENSKRLAECAAKWVFHLAAPGVRLEDRAMQSLVDGCVSGTVALLAALKDQPPHRFIYAGSWSEYDTRIAPGVLLREDHPVTSQSLYGAAKASGFLIGQAYARQHSIPFLNLRFFNLFGPGEEAPRLLPYVCKQLLEGKTVRLTPGDQRRDFVFIEDAVDAMVRVAFSEVESMPDVMNVATGSSHTVKALVQGAAMHINADPGLLEFGALPMRADEPQVVAGDPSLIARCVDWHATTPFEDALRQTADYHVAAFRKASEPGC